MSKCFSISLLNALLQGIAGQARNGEKTITAIAALTAGIIWKIYWMDCVFGIVGAIVITKWALSLMWNAGKELIDFEKSHAKQKKSIHRL